MTIISPTTKKSYTSFFIKMFLVVALGAVLWIYQYNALADMKHEIKDLNNQIANIEVENAELKSQLYEVTDPSQLETVAMAEGLVIDPNPKYLNLNQWVSDSSF